MEHGRPVILTDFVVNATTWGKALTNRPGVYVAGSTADVLGAVDQVVQASCRDDSAVLSIGPGQP